MDEMETLFQQEVDQDKPAPTEQAAPEQGHATEQPKPPESTPTETVDPEFDLGLDKDGKPLKFTKTQILEMQKSGLRQEDYTKKTQELSAQREQVKEMFAIVDMLKANPKKAEQVIAILEAKEEQIQEQKDELDEMLKELPEDDPYAKVIRSQRAQLQKISDMSKQLQGRLDKYESANKSVEESKHTAEAQQVLNDTLSEAQKALKFIDDEEAQYWKRQVLTYLVHNPADYNKMDKQQFVEYLKGLGNRIHEDINKIGEKRIKQYLASKGPGAVPPPGAGASGKPLKAKPNVQNLDEMLQDMLTDESNNNK